MLFPLLQSTLATTGRTHMKRTLRDGIAALLCLMLAAIVTAPWPALAASEESFDVLQIGTHTYRNVTVTTKSKNYVFLLHSTGMTNIKVADLPPDVLTKLGYEDPTVPKVQTNAAKVWAQQTLSKLEVPAIKGIEEQIKTHVTADEIRARLPVQIQAITRNILLVAAGTFLAIYLFYCFCCMLICKKTGNEPGLLVWLPILKLFPLLKAAGMSGWWFLAYLVPGLNVIAQVIWSFKIADARGKTAVIGVCLVLPVIISPILSAFAASQPAAQVPWPVLGIIFLTSSVLSLLAFLFLAFSSSSYRPAAKVAQPVEIMTLETV
jgi:hypothetical protein